jgi:ubiquinone/menaquinone biosynthesis C-methylase UbiE
MKLRHLLPISVQSCLFGNRAKFSRTPVQDDKEWIVWKEKSIIDFYENTQKRGIGNWVCNLAYPFLAKINFKEKSIIEIGPGDIRHLKYINSKPNLYTICDVEKKCLDMSKKKLDQAGIPNKRILLEKTNSGQLPFSSEQFDFAISFNTLEHLYPLDSYLIEIDRVLKKGGLLLGGVPCEGGLAWGLGRLLTTRRYVHINYGINYDKIICWEHPNFVDYIIIKLDTFFERKFLRLHPFPWLPMDFNLVSSFSYQKT